MLSTVVAAAALGQAARYQMVRGVRAGQYNTVRAARYLRGHLAVPAGRREVCDRLRKGGMMVMMMLLLLVMVMMMIMMPLAVVMVRAVIMGRSGRTGPGTECRAPSRMALIETVMM